MPPSTGGPGVASKTEYQPIPRNFSTGVSFRSVFRDVSAMRTAAGAAHRILSRRKQYSANEGGTRLARVLTAVDLTALGVGSTLGMGVYVLAGSVSKQYAGPAVIVSFLIAAIASIFAGLCYAEFGARVPKAGSAYVYSYVCVGEFVAFVIGWNLILEYIIGSASVAKGLSQYLDSMFNHTMSHSLRTSMPLHAAYFAEEPDIFAFTITMVFSIALAFGAKESSRFNNLFTLVNLCVVFFLIISGSFKADPTNWRIDPKSVPTLNIGSGGFAPYGVEGIIKGAAVCFYGFIGFDCVATAGEEAKNPQKTIPIAVVASLLIVFLAYFGVSAILTLMLPYYLQDVNAPFPHVYEHLGWHVAKYVVSVGALCGLCSSLLGAMFPLPRIIYAMASDGLVFQFMGVVNKRFQTPLVGTLVAGLLTGTLAMMFKLEQLINMMSIGTLLAYSMVAYCVLLLRYDRSSPGRRDDSCGSWSLCSLSQLLNLRGLTSPTSLSASLVNALVMVYCAWCMVIATIVNRHFNDLAQLNVVSWSLLTFTLVAALATLYCISRQPVSDKKLAFSVPLVPWLPGFSILINVYLMFNLDFMTWVRFIVWITAGLILYFAYGVWHSAERAREATPLHTTDDAAVINLTALNQSDSQTSLLHHQRLIQEAVTVAT